MNAGQARAAALYDFKTDEHALAENYSMQMSLYRKSLGALIGLPEDKITSMLILVRTGEEFPVPLPRRPRPNEPCLGQCRNWITGSQSDAGYGGGETAATSAGSAKFACVKRSHYSSE